MFRHIKNTMVLPELITKVQSGLAQLYIRIGNEVHSVGTGFLVKGGLVTNSHVIRPGVTFDALLVRLEGMSISRIENFIQILSNDLSDHIVAAEATEKGKDFAYLRLNDKQFESRHIFELSTASEILVGEQILFMGYPFGMNHLTAHTGYISSKHVHGDIQIMQIDGSVNGGNSGGPLLDLRNGFVVGIVTRAVTGIIESQFDALLVALKNNQKALEGAKGRAFLSGIDPLDAVRASMAAMEKIAIDLRRSANVGIGYAYSAEYVAEFVK